MSFPFSRNSSRYKKNDDASRVPVPVRSSMYSSFLLGSSRELFTAGKEDEESALLLNGQPSAPPAPSQSDDDDEVAEGVEVQDVAADATVVGVAVPFYEKAKCFSLRRRNIHILNVSAAVVHAILFVVLFFLAMGKDKQSWHLKQDRTQTIPSFIGATNPFVTIGNQSCNPAKPNTLNFTNSSFGPMQTWTYPQDSGYSLDLTWLVMGFFLLSSAFQLVVSIMSTCQSGYYAIFASPELGDETYEERFVGNIVDGKVKPFLYAAVGRWCSDMLAFNVLRFVEYTFSGSLVLVIISVVAGIVDIELLACIFLLSATCMLLGLVAEYCMRGSIVLKVVQSNMKGSGADPLMHVLYIVRGQLKVAFLVSHILAWLCIILPWYIIYLHYLSWWNQCGFTVNASGTKPATTSEPQPPDFVKAIIFVQAILYLLFGLVQLVQFFLPHKRRAAEVSYIILSLTAKVILGSILAANVLLA